MEIYLITDLTNGKKYVGQTINTKEQRWSGHLCGNLYVDNAIRKHGIENTTLETLEYVYDESKLNEKEQYWIKKLDTLIPNGYNILPGGDCHYGLNTVHEFNKEQYLRKIFYPQKKRKRDAIKCKIYTIDYNDLNNMLHRVADFEPYKSNKSIDDLSRDEWVYWYKFSCKFEEKVFEIIGHENLCKIAKNVTYAPSISYISDNSLYNYKIYFDNNTISKCIHKHILLSLSDEYVLDNNYDFLYITQIDNIDEYERFAEDKIKSILADWEEHPEKLQEIIDRNKHWIELKTRDKQKRKEENLRKTACYLYSFISLYANRFSYDGDVESGFRAKINIVFDKYDSGVCDSEIEVLVKCKDWIINALKLDQDAFENYVKDVEFEENLAKNKKWKEYKIHKTERKERDKSITDQKKTRKKLIIQN